MKKFAVRFRNDSRSRLQLSLLRFRTRFEADVYAQSLIKHGAKCVSLVILEGRKIVQRMPVLPKPMPAEVDCPTCDQVEASAAKGGAM